MSCDLCSLSRSATRLSGSCTTQIESGTPRAQAPRTVRHECDGQARVPGGRTRPVKGVNACRQLLDCVHQDPTPRLCQMLLTPSDAEHTSRRTQPQEVLLQNLSVNALAEVRSRPRCSAVKGEGREANRRTVRGTSLTRP